MLSGITAMQMWPLHSLSLSSGPPVSSFCNQSSNSIHIHTCCTIYFLQMFVNISWLPSSATKNSITICVRQTLIYTILESTVTLLSVEFRDATTEKWSSTVMFNPWPPGHIWVTRLRYVACSHFWTHVTHAPPSEWTIFGEVWCMSHT